MTSVDGINLAHLHQTFIDLIGISCISRYTLQTCFVWTRLVCSPKINIIIELYLFRSPFNYRTNRYTHTYMYIYNWKILRLYSRSLQLRQTSTPCHNKSFPQTMNSLLSPIHPIYIAIKENEPFAGGDFRVYTTVTANFRVIARQCSSRGSISSPISPERRKKER